MDCRMDTSSVTFPVFGTVPPPYLDLGDFTDVPAFLAKASDGYSNENIIKKLQQTKYDRVIKTVVHDGIQNLLMNRYTPMILPNFQDDDIKELTLICARLKTMGLNASAAAISGECGEVLDTRRVAHYFTQYVPGTRLSMPAMEFKNCHDFHREKINYEKPPYDPENDPVIVQRKIQQLRLHGMSRLRKGLLEMQREQQEIQKAIKKSSGSDSSSSSARSSNLSRTRKIQRPTQLRFPSSLSLQTDSKLEEFNIKRPHIEKPSKNNDLIETSKIFKRSSVNEEILATKLEDSISTDTDSEEHLSPPSSFLPSPNVLQPAIIKNKEMKTDKESSSKSSSNSSDSTESSSSGEEGGEVSEESEVSHHSEESAMSIEEAQFDVVNATSDSDESISF